MESLSQSQVKQLVLNGGSRERFAHAWPLSKQRRSNVDWAALLPEDRSPLAAEQIRYERCRTVFDMFNYGIDIYLIALRFNVGAERVRQMIAEANDKEGRKSPVEAYFSRQSRNSMLDGFRPRHTAVIADIRIAHAIKVVEDRYLSSSSLWEGAV